MRAPHVTTLQLDLLRNARPLKAAEGDLAPDSEELRVTEFVGNRAAAHLRTVSCTAGQVLCREGEVGEALYVIRSGTAAIVKGDFDAPLVLARRGSGELIGEMALLDNLPRSASVVALEPMSLVRLARADFERLMLQSPAADLEMLRKFSQRLRNTDAALTSLSSSESQLNGRVTELTTENRHLLELQHLRQQTLELVIHDLRNPLQGITAAADLLQTTLPKADQARNRKLFTYINAHCNRLQHLVDSMIDISRMETGEMQLLPESADIAEIVRSAIDRARPAFEINEMVCEVKLPPELPRAQLDVQLIDRVITNLLDNAAKYSPRRTTVTVEAWQQGGEIVLAIADTGIGIPREQREQMFERFARGAGPGTQRGSGFGLGLTFCRLAVEAHGGDIWVEDGPGGIGCRFIVTLPLLPNPVPETGRDSAGSC